VILNFVCKFYLSADYRMGISETTTDLASPYSLAWPGLAGWSLPWAHTSRRGCCHWHGGLLWELVLRFVSGRGLAGWLVAPPLGCPWNPATLCPLKLLPSFERFGYGVLAFNRVWDCPGVCIGSNVAWLSKEFSSFPTPSGCSHMDFGVYHRKVSEHTIPYSIFV